MIVIERSKLGLRYRQSWFARTADRGWGLVTYRQFLGQAPSFPFSKQLQHTLLIDLSKDDESLQSDMSKNMRAQLRKAEKDEYQWEPWDDLDGFRELFNAFAAEKKLKAVSRSTLLSERDYLKVGRVVLDGRTLVAHAYLVDKEEGRGRFLYGASVRLAEGVDVNLVGRANRLAHWREMQWLRELGLKTFDFGGYALDTKDVQKQGINQFKEAFGGSIVEESTFDSFWFAWAKRLGVGS